MKKSPIIFSANMVLALLAGRKTVTRRIVKPMPRISADIHSYKDLDSLFQQYPGMLSNPYGSTGDILWVRENWQPKGYTTVDDNEFLITFPADGGSLTGYLETEKDAKYYQMIFDEITKRKIKINNNGTLDPHDLNVRPSIHLWEEFARIWLKIKGIGIERLNTLTDEEAIKEGILYNEYTGGYWDYQSSEPETSNFQCLQPISSFKSLWNSINDEKDWNRNPWVWVVDFDVVSINGYDDIPKMFLEIH